jgi:hypothetical protein
MVRFYLHLQTDGAIWKDPEGVDLPHLDAARQEAIKAAREMAAAAVRAGSETSPDNILITDAKGVVLTAVSLADMIPKRLRNGGSIS